MAKEGGAKGGKGSSKQVGASRNAAAGGLNSAKQNAKTAPLSLPRASSIKDEMATTATPPKDEHSNQNDTTMSHPQIPSTEGKAGAIGGGKKKFNFADLFKNEGMYHSVVNEELLGGKKGKKKNQGLLIAPADELE